MSMAPSDPSNPDPGMPQVPPPGVSEQQQAQMDSVMQNQGMDTTPQINMEEVKDFEKEYEPSIPLGHVPDSFVKRNEDGDLEIHETSWLERRWMSWVQGINLMTNNRDTEGTLANTITGALSDSEDPEQHPLGIVGANLQSTVYSIPTSAGKLAINTINALGTFSGIDMDAMDQVGLGAPNTSDAYGDRYGVASFIEPMAQWMEGAAVGMVALPASTAGWLTVIGGSMVADTIAFDPEHQGNMTTGLRQMNEAFDWWGEDTDKMLAEFDAQHITERDGRKSGYGMMAAEGTLIGLGAEGLFGMFKGGMRGKRWFDNWSVDGGAEGRYNQPIIEARQAQVLEEGTDVRMGTASESPEQITRFESPIDKAHDSRRALILSKVSSKMSDAIAERMERAKSLWSDGYTQQEIEAQLRIEGMHIGRVSEEILIPGFGNIMSDSFGVSRVEGEAIARTMMFGKGADNSTMFSGMDPNKIFVFEGATPQGRALFQEEIATHSKESIGTFRRGERLTGKGTLGKKNTAVFKDTGEALSLSKDDMKKVKEELSAILAKHPMKKDGGQFTEMLLKDITVDDEGKTVYPFKVKRKKSGEITDVSFKWKTRPSTYARDKQGNSLVFGTKAFDKRAEMLSDRIFQSLKDIEETAKGVGPDADQALFILEQNSWYRGMTARYGNEYGELIQLVTEIQGATSAQTPVWMNYMQTQEILQNFSRGDYDMTLKYYADFRADGGTHKEWTKSGNPTIKKNNGSNFGANTQAVMETMTEMWRKKRGLAGGNPKTPNFSGNLFGVTDEATIDLWADRDLQELFDGSMIPPTTSQGVRGSYMTPAKVADHYGVKVADVEANPEAYPTPTFAEGRGAITTDEFGMGQEAFYRAAEKLKNSGSPVWQGITAMELQAQGWFNVKARWTAMDITSEAGEGGSYEAWADIYNATRYNVTGGMFAAVDRADLAIKPVLNELRADDTVRAFTHSPTTTLLPGGVPSKGYQSGSIEITTSNVVMNRNIRDLSPTGETFDKGARLGEVKESPKIADPEQRARLDKKRTYDEKGNPETDKADQGVVNEPTGDSVRRAAAQLGMANQMDRVYIHELVPGAEADFAVNPNLRPGFELRFDEVMDATQMQPFLERLQAEGLSAETIHVVDANPGRANNTKIAGIRSIYVPEDAGVEHLVGNPIEALKHMEEQELRIEGLIEEFLGYDGVKSGDQIYVDTEILRNGEYEQVLQEVKAGTPLRTSGEIERTRQPWFDQPEATGRQPEGRAGNKDFPGNAGEAKLLAQVDDGSPRRVIKGFAEIDERNSSAIIGGMRNPDVGTAVHEVGHALRNHLFSTGVLSEGSRARLTKQFGTDGVWDVAAEERFAEGFMGMVMDTGFRDISDDMGIIAAKMRDLYQQNKGSDWIEGVSADTRAVMEALNTKALPIEYAPGKWMPAVKWSSLIAKIKQEETPPGFLMDVGKDPYADWMDKIQPGDWPGVARMGQEGSMNFRFDLDTDEDILKYLAYFNDLTREMYAEGIIPRLTDDSRNAAAGQLMNRIAAGGADMMGNRVTELLDSKTMRASGAEQAEVHSAVMLANMAQLKWVKKLADRAGNTNDPRDLAKLQRAFLQYQQIQVHASRLRSAAGQTLQAYKSPVPLPTQKALDDAVVSGDFLEKMGMNAKSGQELVKWVQAVSKTGDRDLMIALIEGTNRSGWEIGRRAFFEVYMNALLSAPATWAAISSVSPAAVGLADAGAKGVMAGTRYLTAQFPGMRNPRVAGEQIDLIQEMATNTRRNLVNMKAAIKNMGKVIMDEEAQFMHRNLRDDPDADMRAIQRNMFGHDTWLAKGIQGFFLDVAGRTIRTPSTAIMTIDEGFRTMNGMTAMQMKLYDDHWKEILAAKERELGRPIRGAERSALKKTHSRQINDYVTKEMKDRVRNGQMQTRQKVAERALNDPRIEAIKDPLEQAQAIQAYVRDNHTLEHQRTNEFAVEEGTRAVFQSEMGPVGRKLQSVIDARQLYGTPRVIMPFVRTPVNIQKKFFGMLPTSIAVEQYHKAMNFVWNKGGSGRAFSGSWELPADSKIGGLHNEMMEMLNSGDPRKIAHARGQQAMGVALFYGAYELMANSEDGGITMTGGGGKMTKGDKARLADSGWQPYSIHIPGTGYISMRRMDPFGQVLGIVADTVELLQAEDGQGSMEEKQRLTTALVMTIGSQLKEKSYLQGLSQLMSAMTGDPEDSKKYFMNLQQTLDPTSGQMYFSSAGRHVQHAKDGVFREMRDIVDARRANSWIYNPEDAPPMRNAIGEVRPRQGYGQSESGFVRFLNFTSPMRWTAESDDPVIRELARHDMPINKRSETQGELILTMFTKDDYKYTAFDRWYEILGEMTIKNKITADVIEFKVSGKRVEMNEWTLREALTDLVNSEWYASQEGLTNDAGSPMQGVEMKKLIDEYTDTAFDAMVEEFPDIKVLKAYFARENATRNADATQQLFGKERIPDETVERMKDGANMAYNEQINSAGSSNKQAKDVVERLLNK